MTDNRLTPQQFHGLKGFWAQIASLGVIGVLAMLTIYVVLWELPAERAASRAELRAEREASRADAEKSRSHGQQAAKDIGQSINNLADMLAEIHFGAAPTRGKDD